LGLVGKDLVLLVGGFDVNLVILYSKVYNNESWILKAELKKLVNKIIFSLYIRALTFIPNVAFPHN